MRPTTPVEPDEPQAQSVEPNPGGAGGDETPKYRPKPTRTRARRDDQAAEATRACKLHLPESILDRLHLAALKRKTTASALAGEILRRNLPRLVITEEGS